MLSQFHQSEVREDKIKEAIEREAVRKATSEPPRVEVTESEQPHGEAFDYEDDNGDEAKEDDTDGRKAETVSGDVEVPAEVVEDEEISESVTEIEEIFQVSEDGVTWKTVKKITTITPRGTNERIIVLGGIRSHHGFMCITLFHPWCLSTLSMCNIVVK